MMNVARALTTGVSKQIAFEERGLSGQDQIAARESRFAALVERQSRFVFRIAYAVLRNSHDCEDVVQETFLKLYRSHAWESIRDEKAYLARAAWRIAVDRLPKAGGRMAVSESVSAGISPEDAAIATDWNATIHRLIDALPEELRQPLALSTMEEMNSRRSPGPWGSRKGPYARA